MCGYHRIPILFISLTSLLFGCRSRTHFPVDHKVSQPCAGHDDGRFEHWYLLPFRDPCESSPGSRSRDNSLLFTPHHQDFLGARDSTCQFKVHFPHRPRHLNGPPSPLITTPSKKKCHSAVWLLSVGPTHPTHPTQIQSQPTTQQPQQQCPPTMRALPPTHLR